MVVVVERHEHRLWARDVNMPHAEREPDHDALHGAADAARAVLNLGDTLARAKPKKRRKLRLIEA
jgi:hypothetical protein